MFSPLIAASHQKNNKKKATLLHLLKLVPCLTSHLVGRVQKPEPDLGLINEYLLPVLPMTL